MKMIYLNKETGKEVKYGEDFTYTTTKKLDSGYIMTSTTTLPLINETIPTLIKTGVLVQKEIDNTPKDKPSNANNNKKHKGKRAPLKGYTVEEKLDILRAAVVYLINEVESIKDDIYEGDKD